jgi:hypothetical protein
MAIVVEQMAPMKLKTTSISSTEIPMPTITKNMQKV